MGKAQSLCAHQKCFNAVIPANLIPYCQVAGMEQGTLTVVTGNAIVAAKLRQKVPQLVADMQKGGSQVSGILVKVQVSYPQPERPKATRRLSPGVQDTLNSFGDALTDSPLKEAIQRLGRLR